MMKITCLTVLVLLFTSVNPGLADDRAKLVGTWKVVSFETEFQATAARDTILGKNPIGYIVYTADGRVMTLVTAAGLKAATTDQERAQLWRSMTAWSGTYRVEGNKLIIKIDVSSMPTWVGTERALIFNIDGNRLQTTSEWIDAPLYPEKGKIRTILTYERVK